MKNKLLIIGLLGFFFVSSHIVLAEDASTTAEIIPSESFVTPDIGLDSVATTTENGETFFLEDPEPIVGASVIIDESAGDEPADVMPVDITPTGTYMSGDISEDQTWTKENGPYYISDIYIPSGVTVTVEAGTQIFASGYVAVFGNFVLNGSKTDKIIMDLNPDFLSWYIYVDAFANLNFTGVSINQVDGISTYNGFIHFKDVDYLNATDGIVLSHFGSLIGEGINIKGGSVGVEVVAVDGSTISLRDSVIDNEQGVNANILQGYKGCKLNIVNTKIITSSATPIIMVGGTLSLDGVEMGGGDGDGIDLYVDYSSSPAISTKGTISNTTISGFGGDGIFSINPNLVITDSKILDNNNGIEFYVQGDSRLSVTNSTIAGNVTGVVFGVQSESADINLDMRNNWWGDPFGPYFAGHNDLGFGDEIVGYTEFARSKIQYDPWLAKEPNKRNPVIIIPGIMGSYLNKDDEDKTEVWPSIAKIIAFPGDTILDDLILPTDGRVSVDNNIISKDVFRSVNILNFHIDFFDGLISELESNGYEESKDLFVFPYDWRLDVADNVDGNDNSQVQSLKHKIDGILKQTKSDKVDIVAHSMGGLLAKYYIKHIGTDKVGKFIDIGTPHLGAPKAEKVLVYGDNMSIKFGLLGLNPDEIKKIAQNFPSTYNLLPSAKYFDFTLPDYSYYLYDLGDVDGDGVTGRLSYENTKSFLKNTGRNNTLIQNAELVHNDLDDFNPNDYGIESFNIVGCGAPTIGKIFANNKKFDEDFHYQIKYISGDGTVPQRSAEGMISDNLFYATGIEHATMPSQVGIRNLVTSILGDNIEDFDYSANSNIKTNADNCILPDGKIISIHSPVSLDIYDDAGNHTGPDENGDIEYGIEGVTYDTLDGNKFAFIPNDLNVTIKFKATGTGSAGVDVQDYSRGVIAHSESFVQIPIESLDTQGEVVIGDEGSKILFDKRGNGQIIELAPTVNIEGDLPLDTDTVDPAPSSTSQASSKSGSKVRIKEVDVPKIVPGYTDETTNIVADNYELIVRRSNTKDSAVPDTAGSTQERGVELEDAGIGGIASPAGFFGNIVNAVWNFVVELFNKIIDLFK